MTTPAERPPGDAPANDAWLRQYYTPEKESPAGAAAALTPQPSEKYDGAQRLGAGGEKEVERVHDRDTRRDVALARPRVGRSARHFVREARILAQLEHPNIVPVHDLGLAPDGRPYFTMKLLAGETLAAVLGRLRDGDAATVARFPLPVLLDVFVRVCDAIAFAHSRGVVHRDIKPANVQIGEYGEVRVIDWGLAKGCAGDDGDSDPADRSDPSDPSDLSDLSDPSSPTSPGATGVGTVKGTPGYMAPEQADGRSAAADTRTDIYALGALLYAILTWQPPVVAETTEEVLRRTVAGDIVPPRRRAPGRPIPRALEAIAMKALATQPADRYPTADALLADLRAFTEGYATSAEEAGPLILLWLVIKRHRALSLVVAACLLVMAMLSAVAVARIRASERVAVTALERLQEEEAMRSRLVTAAVPQFLTQARSQIRALAYDEALANLRTTIGLDPSQAEAWELAGCIYLGREQFDQALSAFGREFQALLEKPTPWRGPTPVGAPKPSRPAKDRPPHTDPAFVFAERGRQQAGPGRLPLAPDVFHRLVVDLRGNGTKYARESRIVLGAYFLRHNATAWTNAAHGALVAWAVHALNDGRGELDLRSSATGLEARVSGPASDLLPLVRLPLTSLDLHGTAVRDLQPLRGMPLRMLNLSGTPVANVEPLAGAPLRELRAEGLKRLPPDIFTHCPTLETVIVSAATEVPHHAAWPPNVTIVRR